MGLHGQGNSVLKAVDPSEAVAILGTSVCPGLLFMPSNRLDVLEVKTSNELVCTRKRQLPESWRDSVVPVTQGRMKYHVTSLQSKRLTLAG